MVRLSEEVAEVGNGISRDGAKKEISDAVSQ